jgi:hypothetical protein
MRNAVRRSIRIGLFSLLISIAFGPGLARAQGSAGGSIGNDEKSLSGSREAPRSVETPARRSKPSAEEPRAARKSSGGGSGSFDGAWIVSGVGVTCSGSGSNPIIVTSGKIFGEHVRGTVSPNGALWGTTVGRELTIISTGRLSGRSGGGTFRRSDGCTGTWTASKQ